MSETQSLAGLLAKANRIRHDNRWIFGVMLVSSLVSLTASFALSIEELHLAADPTAVLSCDINSVVSCGAVAREWQSHLLGFPNTFMGLAAAPVVATIAVASLGGVRFPRWFMFAAPALYTVGLGFAYWLFTQSMFVIHALCPWCLLVTLSTTLIFSTLTHVNIRDGNLFLPPRAEAVARRAIKENLDLVIVVIWLLILVLMVVMKYGALLWS